MIDLIVEVNLADALSVEGNVTGREDGARAVHLDHGAAVDAGFARPQIMVSVVTYHGYCSKVETRDGGILRAGDCHLVEYRNDVALFIGTGTQCFLEGAHIGVGRLAGLVSMCWLVCGTYEVVMESSSTIHAGFGKRFCRCDIDGVAVGAGLHIDGQLEFALRLVVIPAFKAQDGFADIAFAVMFRIDAVAVVGKLHIEGGEAAAVKHTHQFASAFVDTFNALCHRVGIRELSGRSDWCTDFIVGCSIVLAGQIPHIDGSAVGGDGVPADGRRQRGRHVVGRIDGQAETGGRHTRRIGFCQDGCLILGDIEVIYGCGVSVIAVLVGGQPSDIGQVQLALLHRGRKHGFAEELIGATLVVHGQHLAVDRFEVTYDGGDNHLHINVGTYVHSVLVIFLQGESDRADKGVAEAVLIGQEEVELRGHLVVTICHLCGAEVVGLVHTRSTRDDRVGIIGFMTCGHHVAEVVARSDNQAEGVGGALLDVLHTGEVGWGLPVTHAGVRSFPLVVAGQGIPTVGIPGRVYQVQVLVVARQHKALGGEGIVVSGRGLRQVDGAQGQHHVVGRIGIAHTALVGGYYEAFVDIRSGTRCSVGEDDALTAADTLVERPGAIGGAVVGVGILYRVRVAGHPRTCTVLLIQIFAGRHETVVVVVGRAGNLVLGHHSGVLARGGHQVGKAIHGTILGHCGLALPIHYINILTAVDKQRGVALFEGRRHRCVGADGFQLVTDGDRSNTVAVRMYGHHIVHGLLRHLHQVAAAVQLLLPEGDGLDVVHRRVELYQVEAAGVDRVNVVDGVVHRGVGRSGVGGADVFDGRIVEPQLVGALHRHQLARGVAEFALVAVVQYVDTAQHIAALG